MYGAQNGASWSTGQPWAWMGLSLGKLISLTSDHHITSLPHTLHHPVSPTIARLQWVRLSLKG